MKRLNDIEVYRTDKREWIVSNVWDEAEDFFFQEVFVTADSKEAGWSRVGAYFIDDDAAEAKVCSAIEGERKSTELGSLVLPSPVRPDTHDRTVETTVHSGASRSAPKWLGLLSKALHPR